jgi:hypothetical protein
MRHFVLRLTGGLLVCTLLVCVTLRHRQIKAEREGPFGNFSHQQILERTISLCRTLLPDTNRLALAAQPIQSQDANGQQQLVWYVECLDPAGEEVATFHWDARTGDLLIVGNLNAPSARSGSASAAAAQTQSLPVEQAKARAAFLSYQWLHRLGIAAEGSRWRLTQAPERTARRSPIWSVSWRSGDHEALLKVDVGSDLLYSAQNWPLSESKEPEAP